jgi:Flp pilus assembly protein TadG
MVTSKRFSSISRRSRSAPRGQAAVEFAIIATVLLVLLLALVDFSRALYSLQVMVGLTRQGSNLASRGDSLTEAAASVVAGDSPLNLTNNGEVIVTSVMNNAGVNQITGQASQGGTTNLSKIGTTVGARANIPASATTMLQPGQTVYITEIFYTYKPITPIGNFVKMVMPSTLYESAYF